MHKIAGLILALAALSTLSVFAGIHPARGDERCDIANRIQGTMEAALPTLRPSIRKHYALRAFRATGDSRYLAPIISDYESTRRELAADLDSIGDAAYVERRCADLLSHLDGERRKDRSRQKMFSKRDDVLLDLSILYDANLVLEYGLPEPADAELLERARAHLRQAGLETFLLDPAVIKVYSAQVANDVYYLKALGVADLREPFLKAFRLTFPDKTDWQLDNLEFGDKVYGLTHVMIAASRYYQTLLDAREYDWILDYFSRNQKRIVEDTKADIIAEVGICFLLCGRGEAPIVDACRKVILEEFDTEAGLIPSPSGSLQPNASEHRNLLAMLLLCWPDHLHPGPLLQDYPDFRDRAMLR